MPLSNILIEWDIVVYIYIYIYIYIDMICKYMYIYKKIIRNLYKLYKIEEYIVENNIYIYLSIFS